MFPKINPGKNLPFVAEVRLIVKRANFRRVLITGGEGMLGGSFSSACKTRLPGAEILSLGRRGLDVTRPNELQKVKKEFKPDLVLHCAALVNAELCEKEPELANEVILGGTRNVVDTFGDSDTTIFYPQSFLVYDGNELPITETTVPRPSFVYGQLKKEAKDYVMARAHNRLVVVMAGFFGGNEKDKNFVGRIIPTILEKVRQGYSEIEIGDRIWQPTFTDDLAKNSLVLLEKGSRNKYCMASYGEASFAELTEAIIEGLGLASKIRVKKVSAQAVAANEAARRPPRAVLSNLGMEEEGLCFMRPWREALVEYLSRDYFRDLVKQKMQDASDEKFVLSL